MSEELTQTEKEYRESATKAEGDAATKKSEAEQSRNTAQEQETESGKLKTLAD